jgi:hypothetical protein
LEKLSRARIWNGGVAGLLHLSCVSGRDLALLRQPWRQSVIRYQASAQINTVVICKTKMNRHTAVLPASISRIVILIGIISAVRRVGAILGGHLRRATILDMGSLLQFPSHDSLRFNHRFVTSVSSRTNSSGARANRCSNQGALATAHDAAQNRASACTTAYEGGISLRMRAPFQDKWLRRDRHPASTA